MTDKAMVDIPSPVHGTVISLGGEPGEVMAVGSILISIEVEGAGNLKESAQAAAPAAKAPEAINKPAAAPVAEAPKAENPSPAKQQPAALRPRSPTAHREAETAKAHRG